MTEELGIYKPKLRLALTDLVEKIRAHAETVSSWTNDVFRRLGEYTSNGKMIRGALVSYSARIARGQDGSFETSESLERLCLQVGAAMELIQALLLIHDDIMDGDMLRRGAPSVHAQYAEVAREAKAADPHRLGESLGICAGDVAGFLAFDVLSNLDVEPKLCKALISLTSRELVFVALAQMSDVFNAGVPCELSADDILKLYRYKTGRYTFSLPLMAGALCTGVDHRSVTQLGELGELLGVIFQIKDDEIGLFSPSESSGKPNGSDIVENKKTLHRLRLLESVDAGDRKKALSIFGNRASNVNDFEWVREKLKLSGTIAVIGKEMQVYAEKCRDNIDSLPFLDVSGRKAMYRLLDYNLTRNS